MTFICLKGILRPREGRRGWDGLLESKNRSSKWEWGCAQQLSPGGLLVQPNPLQLCSEVILFMLAARLPPPKQWSLWSLETTSSLSWALRVQSILRQEYLVSFHLPSFAQWSLILSEMDKRSHSLLFPPDSCSMQNINPSLPSDWICQLLDCPRISSRPPKSKLRHLTHRAPCSAYHGHWMCHWRKRHIAGPSCLNLSPLCSNIEWFRKQGAWYSCGSESKEAHPDLQVFRLKFLRFVLELVSKSPYTRDLSRQESAKTCSFATRTGVTWLEFKSLPDCKKKGGKVKEKKCGEEGNGGLEHLCFPLLVPLLPSSSVYISGSGRRLAHHHVTSSFMWQNAKFALQSSPMLTQ